MQRLQQHSQDELFVSIVSFHEQVMGWAAYIARARDQATVVRGYGMFQEVLTNFVKSNLLPFDSDAARIFERLRKARLRVGTMDLRIGAIALAHGLTVLTRNKVDFERIPDLHIEDWTGPIESV